MSSLPPLPAGFTLDEPSQQEVPPLPAGFTLDAPSAPTAQADPFAGDPLLSREAMARLAAGELSTVEPSRKPSAFRGLKKYAGAINEAVGQFNRAKPAGLAGALETAAALGSGIAAPVLGTAESIALGTPPEESFERYTYRPRTESSQAQLGMLGALVSPITQSGADIALAPLLANHSRTLSAGPARIGTNARHARTGRDSIPDESGSMDGALAARQEVPTHPAQADWSTGLGKISKAPPTIEELSSQAKDAYKRAFDAGITVSPESFAGLKAKIAETLIGEGIDPTLHPSSSAALNRIANADGAMTLDKLETLRKIAKDAQKSNAPADRRLASMLVEEIDDYVTGLGERDVLSGDPAKASALKEARNLYARKSKAEEIHSLIERAEISAPNFSGSGMENALRTEFRALAKNERRMRRFTPDEQEAIKKVATGGNVENALRMLGKFAPTGVVSAGISSGLGFMSGGPLGAAALPALGAASRYGATRMTTRNARLAEELMRRGPQQSQEAPRRALAEALLR